MGFTLWSFNVAIENGPVEIVALPMKNGGSFHSYVTVYQRVDVTLGCIQKPDRPRTGGRPDILQPRCMWLGGTLKF